MMVDLDRLALAGYDVALGTSTWSAFLDVAQRQFEGRGATLLEQTADGRAAAIHAASGLEASTLQEYETYYRGRNVFLLHREHLWTPGFVRTEETGLTATTLMRTEYYNDFMRPHDLRRAMSTTALRSTGSAVHLTIFRGHRAPEWETETMQCLERLSPHLRRAAQLFHQVGELTDRVVGLEAVVERVMRGAALLDGTCRPRYVNQPLRAMTSPLDGLLLAADRLMPELTSESRRFRTLVADAAGGGSGGTMRVSRRTSKPGFAILVAPFRPSSGFGRSFAPLVLVTVGDPSLAPAPGWSADLRYLFGLTPAEARLASSLASGRSLQESAAWLGISVLTARTHLKRVLQKTGTHRQSELVLLLRSA